MKNELLIDGLGIFENRKSVKKLLNENPELKL